MGPIDMPFGMLDYLGDLAKFPKCHHASPIGSGPMRGAKYPGRFLSFLTFLPLDETIVSVVGCWLLSRSRLLVT